MIDDKRNVLGTSRPGPSRRGSCRDEDKALRDATPGSVSARADYTPTEALEYGPIYDAARRGCSSRTASVLGLSYPETAVQEASGGRVEFEHWKAREPP